MKNWKNLSNKLVKTFVKEKDKLFKEIIDEDEFTSILLNIIYDFYSKTLMTVGLTHLTFKNKVSRESLKLFINKFHTSETKRLYESVETIFKNLEGASSNEKKESESN